MERLIDSYRVDGVDDLCRECVRWADDAKGRMLKGIGPRLRNLIRRRAEMLRGKRKPWWRWW